jgi:hypothetical protein
MAGPYDNSGLFERMLSIPRRGGFHTATKGTANTHIDFAPPPRAEACGRRRKPAQEFTRAGVQQKLNLTSICSGMQCTPGPR